MQRRTLESVCPQDRDRPLCTRSPVPTSTVKQKLDTSDSVQEDLDSLPVICTERAVGIIDRCRTLSLQEIKKDRIRWSTRCVPSPAEVPHGAG